MLIEMMLLRIIQHALRDLQNRSGTYLKWFQLPTYLDLEIDSALESHRKILINRASDYGVRKVKFNENC